MKVRDDIVKIKMYKTNFCADCVRADHFFKDYDINPEKVNIDEDKSAESEVIEINNGNRSVPTIIVEFAKEDSKVLVEPSRETLENTFLKK